MASAFSKKLVSALFAAAALTGGMLPAMAAEPQAKENVVQDAEKLRVARHMVKEAGESILRDNHTYAHVSRLRSQVEETPAVAIDVANILGQAIQVLPMKEWPQMIEVLGYTAYKGDDAARKVAIAVATMALQNATNAMDIANASVREESMNVLAKVGVHFEGGATVIKPYMEAALDDKSSLLSSSAIVAMNYIGDMVYYNRAAQVADLYPALKNRLDAWQKKYVELDFKNRAGEYEYGGDRSLNDWASDFSKTIGTYTTLSAALPEKAPEAIDTYKSMLPAAEKRDVSSLLYAIANIVKKNPQLADKGYEIILSYKSDAEHRHTAAMAVESMGRKQPALAKRSADILLGMMKEEQGSARDLIRSIEWVAKEGQLDAAEYKDKIKAVLFARLDSGKNTPQTAYDLAVMAEEDQALAAAVMEKFVALSEKDGGKIMHEETMINSVYNLGRKPEQRGAAVKIFIAAMKKAVDANDTDHAERFLDKISRLKELTRQESFKKPAPRP